MRQMPAMRQVHAHDRIAEFQDGLIDRQVRVDPRVDLDVGMVCPEERPRAVDRELLDLVGDLGATVVAAPGYPSPVLSSNTEPSAARTAAGAGLSDADQAQRRTLTLPLPIDERCDGRIDDTERLLREWSHLIRRIAKFT